MSQPTATGLTAARQVMTLLDKAETSATWNSTVLTIREARRYLEKLMMLNLTGTPGDCAARERKGRKRV
jgi:hypothetical protein